MYVMSLFFCHVYDFMIAFSEGSVSCMSDLHTTYLNVCSSNGIDPGSDFLRSLKLLKQFLSYEIHDIVFTPAKQKQLSDLVSLSVTRDAIMWKLQCVHLHSPICH